MNDFDHVEFKKHLKKIIGYLDEMTSGLNRALDAYLLKEEHNEAKDIKRVIKHYKIKVKNKKKKGTRS